LSSLQQLRAPAKPLMAGLTVDTFFFFSCWAAMVLPLLDALVPKIGLSSGLISGSSTAATLGNPCKHSVERCK
jgi:hypothetical protein